MSGILNLGVVNIASQLLASSTLSVAGNSVLNGASTTVSRALNLTGPVSASSTLSVAGNTVLNGASSTVSGVLKVSGGINASSTIFTSGDILASSTAATTTLRVYSGGGNFGGCIDIQSASGTPYRLYVGAGDEGTTTPINLQSSGRNNSVVIAVWERGTCK